MTSMDETSNYDDTIETNIIKADRNSIKNLEFICEIHGFV